MHKEQVTPKELGGSERLVFDEQDIKKIEELAPYVPTEQIAEFFCIGRATFYDILKRQPEVAGRYKAARVKKTVRFAQQLEKKALGECSKGELNAIIFYLKTRARWSEAVPETKIEEEITETPDEKAARMKEVKLYTEFKNDFEAFTQWKKETSK
jgi:hypothetical protein